MPTPLPSVGDAPKDRPMPASARQTLRAATAHDHETVDAAFAAFDLGDRAHYAAFLRAQAAAFLPVEAAIDRSAPEAIVPDWPTRRRAPALIADLTALGIVVPPADVIPAFTSAESTLGAIYVLEGSRLGGRMLARSIPADVPRSFLDAGNSGQWRTLIDLLDATLTSAGQVATATDAARAVFARFEAGAKAHRKDLH